MADYDLAHKIKEVNLITPAVYSADTTPTALDTAGYKSVVICTNVDAGGISFSGTNKIELKLTHSDDNSTYAAVADDDVLMPYGETLGSGGIIRSFTAAKASADTTLHKVGYRGKKRYLKLLADFSGTHGTGTGIEAHAVLGNPMSSPANEQSSYESQTAWPTN